MNIGNKKIFPGEVAVHIDIEYHVEFYLLVSGEDLTTTHQEIIILDIYF